MKQYILEHKHVATLILINNILDDIISFAFYDLPRDIAEETESLQIKLEDLLQDIEKPSHVEVKQA